MTGYYDYVLGLIPVSLIGIAAALSAIGLPMTVAVPGGAVVAAVLIAHAMFVRVPVDRSAESGTALDAARDAERRVVGTSQPSD